MERVTTFREREKVLYVATDGSKDCFHSFFCTNGETGWYPEIVIEVEVRQRGETKVDIA